MHIQDLKIGNLYYCTQDNQYCLYLRKKTFECESGDEYWFWFFRDNEELFYQSHPGEQLPNVREL